jgi:hypothetical protein
MVSEYSQMAGVQVSSFYCWKKRSSNTANSAMLSEGLQSQLFGHGRAGVAGTYRRFSGDLVFELLLQLSEHLG